jgi:hypothetical protein
MTLLSSRSFASLVAVALGTAACVASSAPEADSEDVTSTVTAAQLSALFHAVDDNCAGNDNGWLTKFDVKKFDASAIAKQLRVDDKDASGVDCSDQHDYATSRENGVAMFLEHIRDENESTKTCLAENLTPAQRKLLEKVVGDPKNLGVFASVYSGGDNPEGCDYYRFSVYRRDGWLFELAFNFTD